MAANGVNSPGFVKLDRALQNSEIWTVKPFSKGQAWVDLIMIANYAARFITAKNGVIIRIERGECGYSVVALAEKWGWSRGKVIRFLTYLNRLKMIQQKTIANHTITKICNYEYYQGDTTNGTTNGTTNSHQTVQQTDTREEFKEFKEENSLPGAGAHEGDSEEAGGTEDIAPKSPEMVLTPAELSMWNNWMTVWQEIHGGGRPMPAISSELQLLALIRFPAEYRLVTLEKAAAGRFANIRDVRGDADVKARFATGEQSKETGNKMPDGGVGINIELVQEEEEAFRG
ncbi:MAG: hypothetical protein AB7F32_05025 [Victivallaceae bacterium]